MRDSLSSGVNPPCSSRVKGERTENKGKKKTRACCNNSLLVLPQASTNIPRASHKLTSTSGKPSGILSRLCFWRRYCLLGLQWNCERGRHRRLHPIVAFCLSPSPGHSALIGFVVVLRPRRSALWTLCNDQNSLFQYVERRGKKKKNSCSSFYLPSGANLLAVRNDILQHAT